MHYQSKKRIPIYGFALALLLHTTAYAAPTVKDIRNASANPLFVQNKGQILDEKQQPRNDIDFKLNTGAVEIFIGNGQIHYQYAKWNETISNTALSKGKTPQQEIAYYSLKMRLLGANTQAKVETYNQQKYQEHYYLPHCPDGTTANSYKKIVYKNVYPNIDWVLYASGTDYSGIKYDFVVHPGGNPKDIKLAYEGASDVSLKNGTFTASTPMGTLTEQKPYSYIAETKKTIASSFVLSDNVLSFDVATQHEATLVIDPVLNWGTYYGNTEFSPGNAIAADSFGNVYLCGYTKPSTSIASVATVYQPLYGGGLYDGYIVKFALDGTRDWATFFGGQYNDFINAATCDKDGNIIFAGTSTSYWELSSAGMHQQYNGSMVASGQYLNDAFVAKFNSSGIRQWSTFYGGLDYDEAFAVAADRLGDIYVGGNTNSTNAIATTNAWLTTPSAGFVVKFSAGGVRQWGTYYRGTVNDITCDADNNVYFGGFTTATTGIASTIAHLTTFAGGACDGYIAKLNTSGTTRLWGTYLGGADYDEVFALATDSFRNLYVGGNTLSNAGIATSGAFDTSYSGNAASGAKDAYLIKFNSSGVRQWGTYMGDSLGSDAITDIDIAPDGALYCFGRTGSYTTIATPGNFSTTNKGPLPNPPPSPYYIPECEHFVVRFTQDCKKKWGTYYGDTGSEYACKGVFAYGKIFIGGGTISGQGIATSNGWQAQMAGVPDVRGYVAQFQADTNVFIKFPYTDTSLCAGDTLHVRFKTINKFRTNNVFTVQLSNVSGSFATPVTIGSATLSEDGTVVCIPPITTPDGRGYKIRIISSAPRDTFYNYDVPIRISQYRKPQAYAIQPVCENTPIQLGDASFPQIGNFTWSGPLGFTSILANTFVPTATLAKAGDYILECDNFGCKAKDTVNVVVVQSPAKSTIDGDTSICIGDTLLLTASCPSSGITFQWIDPKLTVPQNDTFFAAPVDTSYRGRYRVTAITTLGNCPGESDTVNVYIRPLPNPTIPAVADVCSGDSIKLTSNDTAAVITYSWRGPTGFTANTRSPNITPAALQNSGTYTVTHTNQYGCIEDTSVEVRVKQSPDPVTATNNSPICSTTELKLTANNNLTGTTFAWAGPSGFTSASQNPTIPNASVSASGIYTVVVELNGCKKSTATTVTINTAPDSPRVTGNTPLYIGEILKLNITNVQNGVAYAWTGPNNFTSNSTAPILNSAVLNIAGKYTVTASIADCIATGSIVIDVQQKPEQVGKVLFVYPNPNNGSFTLVATTKDDANVPIVIFETDGKEVHSEIAKPQNKKLEHKIDVRGRLAAGVYRVKVRIDGEFHTISVTVQ